MFMMSYCQIQMGIFALKQEMIVTEMIKSLILKNPNYVYMKEVLELPLDVSQFSKMINEAKNIGVMVKSLSRNPFKRGEPEENTKLAILIVENGIKNENGED